jgi:hypothetical protein
MGISSRQERLPAGIVTAILAIAAAFSARARPGQLPSTEALP